MLTNDEIHEFLGDKLRELSQVYDNLTSSQERCNELLEENRALYRRIDELENQVEILWATLRKTQ